MKFKFAYLLAASLAVMGAGVPAASATTVNIGFEGSSNPSLFANASGPQTIASAPATFSGGVILSDPASFPIFDSTFKSASNSNVYGTADFGTGLATMLSIAIDSNFNANEVSFTLFNGETFIEDYIVSAFSGNNLLGTQKLTNLASNQGTGEGSFGFIDLQYANITKIDIISKAGIKFGSSSNSISSSTKPQWDFLIDNVSFIGNPIALDVVAPAVPEPETYTMILTGFGLMGFMVRRRKHNSRY